MDIRRKGLQKEKIESLVQKDKKYTYQNDITARSRHLLVRVLRTQSAHEPNRGIQKWYI